MNEKGRERASIHEKTNLLINKTIKTKRFCFPKIFIRTESLSEIWSISQKIFIGPESLSEIWSILGIRKIPSTFPKIRNICFQKMLQDLSKIQDSGNICFKIWNKLNKLFPKKCRGIVPIFCFVLFAIMFSQFFKLLFPIHFPYIFEHIVHLFPKFFL